MREWGGERGFKRFRVGTIGKGGSRSVEEGEARVRTDRERGANAK
jgi:hypothetical protein